MSKPKNRKKTSLQFIKRGYIVIDEPIADESVLRRHPGRLLKLASEIEQLTGIRPQTVRWWDKSHFVYDTPLQELLAGYHS